MLVDKLDNWLEMILCSHVSEKLRIIMLLLLLIWLGPPFDEYKALATPDILFGFTFDHTAIKPE
ncbi:hypothetical protein [Paenibacillus psychroresistens]|nr:hypothetical protein [Paenibacillus psychroresistens]